MGVRAIEPIPLTLKFSPTLKQLTSEEFFQFCRLNPDWRIERTAHGDLVIMPPTGGETGRKNFKLTGQFSVFVEEDGTGVGFDSSTGFTLPNGAKRSPDLAWVARDRWDRLSPEERDQFPPLCPDFVVELRSRSDSLEALQAKLREYMDNGAQLGWLLDPVERRVHVYTPGGNVQCLEDPAEVSAVPLLPRFVLKMSKVWD